MLNYMQFLISWILKYCKLAFIREQKKNRWEIYTMFNEFIVDLLNCKCFFFFIIGSIKMPLVSTAMQYESKPSNLSRNISMLTLYSCQVLYYWYIFMFFSFIYIFLQELYNTTCHFKLFTVYNLTYFLWYISILESLINKYIE